MLQKKTEKILFNGLKEGFFKKGNKGVLTSGKYLELQYSDRNLRFEFAATFFEAEERTLYRCFLEGYDEGWSSWKEEPQIHYTNLGPGNYTFRVQAQNVYRYKGEEDRIQFKILPPFYRTWWAYLSYFILLLLLIYGIVKWRLSRLRWEKVKLEGIVHEKTREVREKNRRLELQAETLQNQSEELKEMNKVKSRFFANISHEFRTPLTLILSPLEQMLAESRDGKTRRLLGTMLRNSQMLLTLINKLLDLARFDSGAMKLQAAYQDIVPFVKGVLSSFEALAEQNGLALKFETEKEKIPLYFDGPKLEDVLYNLLINAVKFTAEGGCIRVSVSLEAAREPRPGEAPIAGIHGVELVKLSVKDTGCGIPREQLNHIFDRFYQARGNDGAPGDRVKKGQKGTGLGLSLAREIVVLHGGKIDVHSVIDEGTEFVVQLQLGHEHLKPDEIILRSEAEAGQKSKQLERQRLAELDVTEEVTETVDVPGLCEKGERGENIEKTGTEEKGEKNVILVVEDNADVRRYICEPLLPGYEVVEACDGREGLEKARELVPDLIVSDIMMPEKDGLELARELKRDIRTSHIPIILLTAKASEESQLRGLERGVDDYVTKPFSTKLLLARIGNLIDLRRQLQLKIQREKMLLPSEIKISSPDDEFLKKYQGIVEKNLRDEEFNIETLCEELYMTRAPLFRKLKALTGETPNQFIQTYRLKRAAQLMKQKAGNVTEIAGMVGFSSPAYFAKCFREKFNQSPSSYMASESEIKKSKTSPKGL